MAKRFTDSEKWGDPWFCELSKDDRLFWVYLLDNCDHAGIWKVNWPLVAFYFGAYKPLASTFENRVVELSPDKWFVRKFVDFQYGSLNPENRAHLSVITVLQKEGAYKHLISSFQGAKEKEKEYLKEKGGVGEKTKNTFAKPEPGEVSEYAKSIGFDLNGQEFCDFYASKGWVVGKSPMKDWKAAVRTWKSSRNGEQSKPKEVFA